MKDYQKKSGFFRLYWVRLFALGILAVPLSNYADDVKPDSFNKLSMASVKNIFMTAASWAENNLKSDFKAMDVPKKTTTTTHLIQKRKVQHDWKVEAGRIFNHVMGPGRVYRRIDSSPMPSRTPRIKKTRANTANITLELRLDMGALASQVGFYRKNWKVVDSQTGRILTGEGPRPKFSLQPGKRYKVTLKIDQAVSVHTVNVHKSRNKVYVETIRPKFGLINAKSNHYGNYLSGDLVWQVNNIGGTRIKKEARGRSVKTLVPVGTYDVVLKLSKVAAKKRMSVGMLQQVNAVVNMPTARVKLSAWDGRSLMGDRDTTLELWYGSKASGRNRVFRHVRKHASDTVAPGTYTAVLLARNRRCKKTFLVPAGSNKEYKLNLQGGYCA